MDLETLIVAVFCLVDDFVRDPATIAGCASAARRRCSRTARC